VPPEPANPTTEIQQAAFLEAQAQPPQQPGNLPGTRSPFQVEPLTGLGGVILTTTNAQDMQALLEIIKFIQDSVVPQTEIVIQFVPLKQADATSVVSILNTLYQRVNVGPSGTVGLISGPSTTTSGFGPFQQQTTQQISASVALLPVPRFNAIYVATSKV